MERCIWIIVSQMKRQCRLDNHCHVSRVHIGRVYRICNTLGPVRMEQDPICSTVYEWLFGRLNRSNLFDLSWRRIDVKFVIWGSNETIEVTITKGIKLKPAKSELLVYPTASIMIRAVNLKTDCLNSWTRTMVFPSHVLYPTKSRTIPYIHNIRTILNETDRKILS